MQRKKKVSIDFTYDNYMLLKNIAFQKDQSNSALINALIGLFLPVSNDVSDAIGNFCVKKYQEEIEKSTNLSGFAKNESEKNAAQYRQIGEYFGIAPELFINTSLQKTDLRDGYVLFPKDWGVITDPDNPPKKCLYAGVVETLHGSELGIPHFIFFCNYKYSKDYPYYFQDKIIESCSKICPDFKKVLDEKNVATPYGFFSIVEKGDPIFYNGAIPDYTPPYGAIIIRCTN